MTLMLTIIYDIHFVCLVCVNWEIYIYCANSCPENAYGALVDATDPTKGCGVDETTGLPSNCVFELYPYQTDRASLMYAEHLPSVSSDKHPCIG